MGTILPKEQALKKLKINVFVVLILLFAVVLTTYSQRAAEYASSALKLCAHSIIPSLFPYMVVSSMIVSSKVGYLPGKLLPVSRLFSLPDSATCAILLGALCGFPVGAKTAVSLYLKGELTKKEAEILISAANNTGPSFVVFVIGGAFFNSNAFGWHIYISQLISSLICAVFVNRIIFGVEKNKHTKYKTTLSLPDFFSAVSDSAASIITVCAFIVFFSVIQGFLLPLLTNISADLAGGASAVLEFTQGARYASVVGGIKGKFLAGLSVGWSGLSVFFQTVSFTAPHNISLKRTLCTKALQGVICGLLSISFPLAHFDTNEATAKAFTAAASYSDSHISTIIILTVLFSGAIVSLLLKKKQKHLDL